MGSNQAYPTAMKILNYTKKRIYNLLHPGNHLRWCKSWLVESACCPGQDHAQDKLRGSGKHFYALILLNFTKYLCFPVIIIDCAHTQLCLDSTRPQTNAGHIVLPQLPRTVYWHSIQLWNRSTSYFYHRKLSQPSIIKMLEFSPNVTLLAIVAKRDFPIRKWVLL